MIGSTLSTQQGGGGPTGPGGPELDRDDVFHVLRNRRRRYALHYLKRREEAAAEIGEIADQVAAWENEISVPEVTSTQRKRVYNALQQTHLPELDDTGFVEYERGHVELTPQAAELDIYLELVSQQDVPWSEYYLGLGAVFTALVAAVWAGVYPFTHLPGLAWATFIAVTLAVSALANFLLQRGTRLGETEEPPEVRDQD
ncbi:MAG: hypothetical protein ABEJ57_02410 [Halobacteriaceae archaeon]